MITINWVYSRLNRSEYQGSRLYLLPDNTRVPSVTTILSKTKPKKDAEALQNWRKSIGDKRATEITTEAGNRGTRMHKWLESYLTEDKIEKPGSNPYSRQSHAMASKIIENYLKPNVGKVFGCEVMLYYPELYAGTTDVVAEWQGKLAIIDFKQSNKPKTNERVFDYHLQICAYALAHNELYQTNIKSGVILVCTPDLVLQKWEVTEDSFDHWSNLWANRIDEYYQKNT